MKEKTISEDFISIHDSPILRCCFDFSSSEFRSTSMEEKIERLKYLVNERNERCFDLALNMMDYCNTTAGKDIKPIDIAMAMGVLLDRLLLRHGTEKT